MSAAFRGEWNVGGTVKVMERKLEDILELAADIVVAETRPRTPVKTGRLKSGTNHKRTGKLERRVFNDVEYAVHQEFGTKFMDPQPFMRPGYRAAMPKIKALLRRVA